MIKLFYLNFLDEEKDVKILKHIQYNFLKRLRKLKYVTHRRIDINLVLGQDRTNISIEWDDGKSSRVTCAAELTYDDMESTSSVAGTYEIVANCLEVLWIKNSWDFSDVQSMLNEIKKEDYFVTVTVGTAFPSPAKRYSAEIVCEIFPLYADYYLQVANRKMKTKSRLHFLKGTPILDLVFIF